MRSASGSNGERRRGVRALLWGFAGVALVSLVTNPMAAQYTRKTNVAHRGASSYAPEHTLEAYRLAIEQKADYVEQDLQITRDGVLVCLHDLTLERTTNVEEIFPDRFREVEQAGTKVRQWQVSDYTLEEIKRLDAGSWFDAKYAGARVPTFQEAIDLVRGKAGLFPETKAPEVYGSRGFNMEQLTLDLLRKNGLDRPGADPKTPVIIQSFSAESLRRMAVEMKTKLPLVFLISERDAGAWLTADRIGTIREFATGIGPAKRIIEDRPEVVRLARGAGLSVTPYTFRSANTGRYRDVREEMERFLYTYDVDAVFTDNPDQFPRR